MSDESYAPPAPAAVDESLIRAQLALRRLDLVDIEALETARRLRAEGLR